MGQHTFTLWSREVGKDPDSRLECDAFELAAKQQTTAIVVDVDNDEADLNRTALAVHGGMQTQRAPSVGPRQPLGGKVAQVRWQWTFERVVEAKFLEALARHDVERKAVVDGGLDVFAATSAGENAKGHLEWRLF